MQGLFQKILHFVPVDYGVKSKIPDRKADGNFCEILDTAGAGSWEFI